MSSGDSRRPIGPVEGPDPDPDPEPTGQPTAAADHLSVVDELGVGSIHQSETLRRDRSPYWLPVAGVAAVLLVLGLLSNSGPAPEIGPDSTINSTMALRMLTTATAEGTSATTTTTSPTEPADPSLDAASKEPPSERELVAESFAIAFVNLDADAALAVLHPEVTAVDLAASGQDDLRDQFAAYEAADVEGEVHGCEELLPVGRVSCVVRTTDRLSRVEDRTFLIDLRMEVEDGLIASVVMNRFAKRQWVAEYWDYFVAWSVENRPDELALAYPNGTSELPDVTTPDGRAAFDSLLDEYHAAFTEKTAAEPSVPVG